MVQAVSSSRASWSRITGLIALTTVVAALLIAAAVFNKLWLPELSRLTNAKPAENSAESDPHAGHDHGQGDANSIELSAQARKNIGLRVDRVQLTDYVQRVSIPGMVVERPGRSTILVSTSMTGIVTQIYPGEGESVVPGQPLFELRLTHEEIVQAQADLLRTAEELDVVAREIERLEKLTADGAIAGKAMLERKYEQQKLEAVHRAQKQALLLHGLTKQQVDSIVDQRTLLQSITVRSPMPPAGTDIKAGEVKYQIQAIKVASGQHIAAGEALATLVDYSSLLIEGNAFEAEAPLIDDALRNGAQLRAVIEREGAVGQEIDGLSILYQSSRVNSESRAIHFYVGLPNEALVGKGASGKTFLTWRYRPGQRMRLLIPAESFPGRIVLPVDALAQDGLENYVFTVNGDLFVRRPVHVEFRDDFSAVIANDGSVFEGDQVALNGAQQLQLALKNKAGGGIDPHAGHNH